MDFWVDFCKPEVFIYTDIILFHTDWTSISKKIDSLENHRITNYCSTWMYSELGKCIYTPSYDRFLQQNPYVEHLPRFYMKAELMKKQIDTSYA